MTVDELDEDGKQLKAALGAVPELPERTLATYARLWQLETWLRRLVYVELRAADGDSWAARFASAERAKEADKRLTHMPTPEDDPLSFAQLSDLKKIISAEWKLFAPSHIFLDSTAKDFRSTVPAVLGSELIISIIERLIEAARYCLGPGLWKGNERAVQELADASPEYILGPEHPLAFLDSEMRCSIFGV